MSQRADLFRGTKSALNLSDLLSGSVRKVVCAFLQGELRCGVLARPRGVANAAALILPLLCEESLLLLLDKSLVYRFCFVGGFFEELSLWVDNQVFGPHLVKDLLEVDDSRGPFDFVKLFGVDCRVKKRRLRVRNDILLLLRQLSKHSDFCFHSAIDEAEGLVSARFTELDSKRGLGLIVHSSV